MSETIRSRRETAILKAIGSMSIFPFGSQNMIAYPNDAQTHETLSPEHSDLIGDLGHLANHSEVILDKPDTE